MDKFLKNDRNPHKLVYLGMRILDRLDFSLTALERIIFLRLLLRYGSAIILKKDLKSLAQQVDIGFLTFKKAVAVLLEKAVLYEVEKGQIRISIRLLKSGLAATKRQVSRSGFSWSNSEGVCPRIDFLVQLFHLLFRIRISHKQKNANQLLILNYQQWLVLLNMVWRSDCHGVVFEASTHELANHTGMSRDALLRAITGLFEFGILRSKLNGTLNNNLLKSVSAIYFLNLSHPIWGSHCVYANYYIVQFPLDYVPVIDRAYELIDLLVNHEQPLATEQINTCISEAHELRLDKDRGAYTFFTSEMTHELLEINSQVYSGFNKDFINFLCLLQPDFSKNNSSLNTRKANLKRIEFLLHYYMSFHSNLVRYDSIFSGSTPSQSMIAWFDQYLKSSQFLKLTPQELELVKDTQSRVLFAITQAIFRSEKTHLLDINAATTSFNRQSSACRKMILLGQSEITDQQVYFAPNKEFTKDSFYKVQFVPVDGCSSDNHFYKCEYQSLHIEQEVDQQKISGLFDSRFQSLDIGWNEFELT